MPNCPNCTSERSVKNGRIHTGKQRELIDRLLLERISLAGIARAAQVSETWLQQYVNEKYAGVQRSIEVTPKKRGG